MITIPFNLQKSTTIAHHPIIAQPALLLQAEDLLQPAQTGFGTMKIFFGSCRPAERRLCSGKSSWGQERRPRFRGEGRLTDLRQQCPQARAASTSQKARNPEGRPSRFPARSGDDAAEAGHSRGFAEDVDRAFLFADNG